VSGSIHFTDIELDVLQKLSTGGTTQQVATEHGFTEKKLDHFLGNIYSRLGVKTREEAVCIAMREEYIPGPDVGNMRFDLLTEPELHAATLLPVLFNDSAIATRLGKKSRTRATDLLSSTRTKLNVKTRTQLAAIMFKLGRQ